MMLFFGQTTVKIYAIQIDRILSEGDMAKLSWLFGNQPKLQEQTITGLFVGPRAAMITPWSTNAVDITRNMAIDGIIRIEEFHSAKPDTAYDPMLSQRYQDLDASIFDVSISPERVLPISDINAYNEAEGLSLSEEEIQYLEQVAARIGRSLTDSEVFGFSQVNSEHCRHKIFNGVFVIDGKEMPDSLFSLIKKTSKASPDGIVSAYKDNVAFLAGPKAIQFAPAQGHQSAYYQKSSFESVISLKAETHNFPTTVEPFNGAATGSGGEIRDRMAGGTGSFPLAGTAVYMTSYSRLAENRSWEDAMQERPWLYQTPMDILTKASNGASDFGNKFGQPLISGSVLTFEHAEHGRKLGFDKVIMLAGGVGYGKAKYALKGAPKPGDRIVVLGGDNYRIGMGGAAVSSADTGALSSGIELNAVQRSNPEMQKRVSNVIRAMVENEGDRIVSIHDHGAGGHLNCLSELVEEAGGKIDLDRLPVGDPTLSAKEIIGNESQERMGLVISPEDLPTLQQIAKRERTPMYDVGAVTGDHRFSFESATTGEKPMDLALSDMFGSSPKTILEDKRVSRKYADIRTNPDLIQSYLEDVLRLESVACKDWLTNKVDRCVGGRVAKQQCTGPLQLPLNNVAVMAIDFEGKDGIATSIGHAPISSLIDAAAGARNAIAEAFTNIIWAPLKNGHKSVSLSANWMWPCRNDGEDARLYEAVQSVSDFCISLGVNIPTGKDSLSMKQKYAEEEVLSPGTVIISSVGLCDDINAIVEPVLQRSGGALYYINLSSDTYKLGGSALGQTLNQVGSDTPDIKDVSRFAKTFDAIQQLIKDGKILAGHDISSGGLITTILEMCFADTNLAADIDLSSLGESDPIKLLFSENSGIVFQGLDTSVEDYLNELEIPFFKIGNPTSGDLIKIKSGTSDYSFSVSKLRDIWYETSWLLDKRQTAKNLADDRYKNYKNQPLSFKFPGGFDGTKLNNPGSRKIKAAIIRDQGSNSERELAHALFLAGFEVKDVHMTDLISGRETLEDIQFIGTVGGFSNSDVLGSAKGWAGSFLYNEKAKGTLDRFFQREDVLSIGICNGCQLFMELGLIDPDKTQKASMLHNESAKHESGFTSVKIAENNSVMLGNLAGSTLGVWISHGEGKFNLPKEREQYQIVAEYGYDAYPANPNGSDYNTAMLCNQDGRHLVTMPHIERSIFSWNWAHYPKDRGPEISPWIQAFINAREWLEKSPK